MMIDRLFLAHPRALNESYFGHARVAGRIGVTMIVGGLACFAHALVPMLFERSASARIARLHARMTARLPQEEADKATIPARMPSLDPVN